MRKHANSYTRKPAFLLLLPLATLLLAGISLARADAPAEIDRLAALMRWKEGTVVADIGAGDGSYSFAAAKHVAMRAKVWRRTAKTIPW